MKNYTVTEKTISRKDTVCDLLNELGMPQNLIGRTYVNHILVHVNPHMYGSSINMKQLYEQLNAVFGGTSISKERAIRYAICRIWNTGNFALQERIFSYTIAYNKGYPTNSEFIAMLINLLRVDEDEI